jgi:hypothetical protein
LPALLQASIFTLDAPALVAVLAMGFLLTRSTRKSTMVQAIIVGLNVALIAFILCAGGSLIEVCCRSSSLCRGVIDKHKSPSNAASVPVT